MIPNKLNCHLDRVSFNHGSIRFISADVLYILGTLRLTFKANRKLQIVSQLLAVL